MEEVIAVAAADPIVVIIVSCLFILFVSVIPCIGLIVIIILSLMIIICHVWHTKWQLNFHRSSHACISGMRFNDNSL